MRSHVKYRNSKFTRIEKNLILSTHPNVKSKIALNIICHKNIQCFFYSVLHYINQLSMLFHVKYGNSNYTQIEKNLNIILAPQR